MYTIIGINCRYSHSCLALFYVRNELEKHITDCKVDIVQLTINDPYYDTLLRITQSDSDALFFSVYIWNSIYVERLLHDIKQVLPEIPIVLGGPQATNFKDKFKNCTVVEGEVEGVNSDFYNDLQKGILAPYYGSGPTVLFQSPYRQNDFKRYLKNRNIYYESSRGCPFYCSYCLSSVKHGVFHKSIKDVRNELSLILKWQPKLIKFVDRTFNDNLERALQIWQFLAKHGGNTKFHFEIAPDRFSEKMFNFLETIESDLFQFEIGIQSVNSKTLNAVNRKMDIVSAVQNIERLISFNTIHVHVDLILGLPHDNLDSFQASFNTVFYMRPHYMQMGLLKVLPGTEISKKSQDYGMVSCKQPTYEVLKNKWLDHKTLGQLHDFGECVESFYNNRYFRSLWSYIYHKNEDPFAFFWRLLHICKKYNFFQFSSTQKILNSMLVELSRKRSDKTLLLELLRYDWLRCGHRFLPESLEKVPLNQTRSELRLILPQTLKGVYNHQGRNEFLKRGTFIKMSTASLIAVGLEGHQGDDGYVCFLPEQTDGVYKHSKVMFISC